MALFGVPTMRKWAKEVAKATAMPEAQGSAATPDMMPMGMTIGPSRAVVPASDIKLVISPENEDSPTHRPKPWLMPAWLKMPITLWASHTAAPDSLRRAPMVRAPQYMNQASQEIPFNILCQSVVPKITGTRRASRAGPPRPRVPEAKTHKSRISTSMPKVTYSAYFILPILRFSSVIAVSPGVRSLFLILRANKSSMYTATTTPRMGTMGKPYFIQ